MCSSADMVLGSCRFTAFRSPVQNPLLFKVFFPVSVYNKKKSSMYAPVLPLTKKKSQRVDSTANVWRKNLASYLNKLAKIYRNHPACKAR